MLTCCSIFAEYKSGAEVWIDRYEDPTFEEQLKDILSEVRPLFEQLHAFVRHALTGKYGEVVVPSNGSIPMHLLGNFWAQTWEVVSDVSGSVASRSLNWNEF